MRSENLKVRTEPCPVSTGCFSRNTFLGGTPPPGTKLSAAMIELLYIVPVLLLLLQRVLLCSSFSLPSLDGTAFSSLSLVTTLGHTHTAPPTSTQPPPSATRRTLRPLMDEVAAHQQQEQQNNHQHHLSACCSRFQPPSLPSSAWYSREPGRLRPAEQ